MYTNDFRCVIVWCRRAVYLKFSAFFLRNTENKANLSLPGEIKQLKGFRFERGGALHHDQGHEPH